MSDSSILGNAKRLTIYLGESDSWRGHSLYMTILETLRKSGIAGATVTRAIAGFGAHSRIRTNAIEVLSVDLPIVISIVDSPEAIQHVLALVSPMVSEGLITLEDVQIVKYSHRHLQPLPADKRIAEVMTREVTSVIADTPAREVVELLLGKLLKAVPVTDDQHHVVGIISSSDLLEKAGMPARLSVGERLDAEDLRNFVTQVTQDKAARDIMTTSVITAREDEALGHVVARMLEHELKRLPVIDGEGKLRGILSRLDVLRTVAGTASSEPHEAEQAPAVHAGRTVGEVMSTDVPMAHVNDNLADVLQKIITGNVKRVIVIDEMERPAGIITDGDLVARVGAATRHTILQALGARLLGADLRQSNATARELMSANVLTAPPDMPITQAIGIMLQHGRKRLVVIDDHGHLLGIVDRQTLMAASLGHV